MTCYSFSTVSKMAWTRGGSFRGSRGASFAQILKKNICAPPGLAVAYVSPAVSEVNNNLFDPACNTNCKLK